MESLILVTGAAEGRQGSTGNHVTRMLLERGCSVRAMVHHDDARAQRLRDLGAQVAVGDMLEIADVERALDGVKRVFFTYPVQDGLLDATATMAAVAKTKQVELLVNVSQLAPATNAPTPRMRQHWLSEQVLDWAGIGAVHLRATVFYENLRALVAHGIAQSGTMNLPWGTEDTEMPLVSAEDVARVAVAVLTGPVRPNGTHIPLIGSVSRLGDIVAMFSAATGKPIRYNEISDEQWSAGAAQAGINAHAVTHLSHLWRNFRMASQFGKKFSVTSSIEEVTGSEPLPLAAFLEREFAGAAS